MSGFAHSSPVYVVVAPEDVGHMPRHWAIDEAAGHRLIEAGLVAHPPPGLHGFSRKFTGDTDCTAAIIEDFAPFAIVKRTEVNGRRATHWGSWDAAYACAKEAHRYGMLIITDRGVPATPWAVVDTRTEIAP